MEAAAKTQTRIHDKFYINGQWAQPHGKGAIDVINSTTEEVLGKIPEGAAADINAAVAAAKTAFAQWSNTPVEERASYLEQIAEKLVARKQEIAELIAAEVGMPLPLATAVQAGLAITDVSTNAKVLREFQFEEQVGNAQIVKEPIGVVGCITPWNFPLHQITAKVAPALAAGCTVV